jgi:hypothetical protein
MSTSPEELIGLLSRWLAGHLGSAKLTAALADADRTALSEEQAEAVDELLAELRAATPGTRPHTERVARETLEALAIG